MIVFCKSSSTSEQHSFFGVVLNTEPMLFAPPYTDGVLTGLLSPVVCSAHIPPHNQDEMFQGSLKHAV